MKPYSIDLRIRVIEAYNRKEGSIRELGKRFALHWMTVANWVKRFAHEGTAGPRKQRHGPLPKLDDAGHESLRQMVKEKPDAIRRELAEQLHSTLGVELSRMGVSRALRRLGLTRKKKSSSASEADKPEVWKAFADFAEAMTKIHAKDLVFVDETGVNLAMNRTHGWAPKGERLIVPEPFVGGQNITIIGALGRQGMITEMMFSGGTDREVFRLFIEKQLAPKLLAGQIVVLDNYTVHHDPKIRQFIEAVGAKVLFLPPYSPELDPIENAWSKFKAQLRSASARCYEALVEAVRLADLSITPKDALGWFEHCGYSEP